MLVSQRETSPDVAESTLSELVEGNNAFAFDLYQAIRAEEGNLFYSPYSISIALAMTYAGARSDTEQQMADVLHYALPQERLHPAFNALDLELTNNNQQFEEDFTLRIANSMWGQEGYPFLPGFLELIAKNYGSGMRSVDFVDPNNREQARLAINNWVLERTEGKIKDLITKNLLNDFTRLVLANAVYFKADWEKPFLNETIDDNFYLLDGASITVPMMSRRTDTNYIEGEGYQAIELPYKGERMRMIILLPDEGQFAAIENALDTEFANSILQGLKSDDIKLYLPIFEYETQLSLADVLSEMGMPDAFSSSRADFTGMTEKPELSIAHVVHKAFVAVDEIGTEAAAATGVIAEIESGPRVVIKVNRPFIFFIYDKESSTILFIGRVVNPDA